MESEEIIKIPGLTWLDKVEKEHETPITLGFKEPYQIKQKEVDELIEDWKKYQRQGVITSSPKEKITWIDMAEKDTIESYKRQQIGGILMGKSKYKMKRNRLEMEMIALRDSTEENYMLNKMVNTDGVEFFAEYTLYKDYNKYFGLTLSGTSINIVDIMEEEFAEFLYHYRLSTIYSQVEAVHEDTWDITPEENEAIKEQMEFGETDKFTPMYDENDIDKQLVVDSKYDMSINSFSESHLKGPEMWTETSTNTGGVHAGMWTETPTNTGKRCSGPSTFGIDVEQLKGIPMELHLKGIQSGFILIKDPTIKSVEERPIKNMEDISKAELVDKVVAVVIEELLTKGTCSLNITLGQE